MTPSNERGAALLMAIGATLLIGALGAGLILISSSETIIAAHFRGAVEARYAAAAMIARGIDDLAGVTDWSGAISGLQQSALVDGAPGARTLADGSVIDLNQAVNLANCQKTTTCSAADLAAVMNDRPWGANNPRWRPYAYGPLAVLLPAATAVDSTAYVLLLIADDPSVSHQGPPGDWEGLSLRAEAFASRGAHAVIEVIAGRTVNIVDGQRVYNPESGTALISVLSWREVR